MGLSTTKLRGTDNKRRPKLPLYHEKPNTPANYSSDDEGSDSDSSIDLHNDQDDGWSTESSSHGASRNVSLDHSARAYMIPKGRQRVLQNTGRQITRTTRIHRLPTRVTRCLSFLLILGLLLFILALVRASQIDNRRFAEKAAAPAGGVVQGGGGTQGGATQGGTTQGGGDTPQPPPSRKPQWENFPFLTRYFGGIRTLLPLGDNVAEYPRAEDEGPVDEVNTTTRALPQNKEFTSYPGAGFDSDVTECFIDAAGTIRVPSLRYYEGRPSGFPRHVYGSYEIFDLPEDICFDRYGKLGPYGLGYSTKEGGTGAGIYGDQEGAEEVWGKDAKVDYSKVDWAEVQQRCYGANSQRFQPLPPKTVFPGFHIQDGMPPAAMIEARGEKFVKSNSTHTVKSSESPSSPPLPSTPSSSPSSKKTPPKETPSTHGDIPRTAVIVRVWDEFEWREEDILNLRSIISEVSLVSGGRYDVHLLMQVKDDHHHPVLADAATAVQRINDTVPEEFRGLVTLWTETQMLALYQGIHDTFEQGLPVHGVYRGLQMAIQHFASTHAEYAYFWHWEMDLRYTGHLLDFFVKTEGWARKQPRKGLWERSGRFYFEDVYGNWEDFAQMVRIQTEMGGMDPEELLRAGNGNNNHGDAEAGDDDAARQTQRRSGGAGANGSSVWGPLRLSNPADHLDTENDPIPPHSYAKDNYEWGVGEEADLISLSPLFDPENTQWLLRNDITGYNSNDRENHPLPPRRSHIVTANRMSRRLLLTMHRETAVKKHFAFPEMWPATVALHHGYKAVYAPHPVYVDREWPVQYMSSIFNGGKDGAVGGGERCVYGEGELHNLSGVGFFYNSWFGRNVWERWLGMMVNNDGGEGFEMTAEDRGGKGGRKGRGKAPGGGGGDGYGGDGTVSGMRGGEGRMCLPPMLLHPVKEVMVPVEVPGDEGGGRGGGTDPFE